MNQTVQTVETSFVGSDTVSNIFSGLRLAELPASFGTRFKVTICAAVETQGMIIQAWAGNRATPIHESECSVQATAGRLVTRDDVVCSFTAEAGEKIQLTATDTTGAANTLLTRLIVQPY